MVGVALKSKLDCHAPCDEDSDYKNPSIGIDMSEGASYQGTWILANEGNDYGSEFIVIYRFGCKKKVIQGERRWWWWRRDDVDGEQVPLS